VTTRLLKFDFKFRALLDPRIDKRMCIRSHKNEEGDHSACSYRGISRL